MIKRKENKKYIVVIIILSILLLISIFFVITFGRYYYKNITKPQYGLGIPNNDNNSSEDIEMININHIMDKKRIIEFDKYGEKYLDKYQGRKYIIYPVILGEHNSILELNDKIKEKVDNYINEFYLSGEIVDKTIDSGELCYVKVLEDGVQKNYCNYLSLEYEVYENNKYISIVEDEVLNSENASGDVKLNDIYIIDKTIGMVISNEDVIKNIDNLSLMKNNLIKYVKENYTSFSYYDVWEIKLEDFVADLDILLSTNSFKIFFENDSIYFYFSKIQGVDDVVFKYINNEWEEFYDMYHF